MDWLGVAALIALVAVVGTLVHSLYEWFKENW